MLPISNIGLVLLCIWLGLASSAAAQSVTLPSGLRPSLDEVLVDTVSGEMWLRFRFTSDQVNPAADAALGFDEIEADLARLCTDLALPYMARHGLTADKIVVSVADRFVAHGTIDPEATQFFEQFRPVDGDCIWEGF